MTCRVRLVSVYGRELVYPANETAAQFARLIGRKTLDRGHLEIIRALGYTIELAPQSL